MHLCILSCILRVIFWFVLAATGFLISNIVFVSVDFLRTALNLQNVTTYQKYANVIKKENMKMHFVWIHFLSKSWENHFIANVRKLILSNTFFIIWNKTTLKWLIIIRLEIYFNFSFIFVRRYVIIEIFSFPNQSCFNLLINQNCLYRAIHWYWYI